MSEGSLSRTRWLVRTALLFVITGAAGLLAVEVMIGVPKVADALGWPRLIVALFAGLLVLGPGQVIGEALTNRLLALLGLSGLKSTLAQRVTRADADSTARRGETHD